MNADEYGEILNGEYTFRTIAGNLLNGIPTFIGWTDNNSTHYDILFTYKGIDSWGGHQRGINKTDLFISIIGRTSYGFTPEGIKHGNYIAEKLGLGDNVTAKKLTELINGVILEMNLKKDI